MASLPKKQKVSQPDSNDISGYLHLVSPVKQSKSGNSYFNAVVQEPTGFTNLVCFSNSPQSIQQQMQQCEKTKSPVTLKNVERCPSSREIGKFDIKFGYKSQLTAVSRKLTFRFETPSSYDVPITLDKIKNINPYQKVTIKAKVLHKENETEQRVKSGETLRMQKVVIADSTETINIVVWQDHIDQVNLGHSYEFRNVTVRMFDMIKSLTTSPESQIIQIEDIGTVKVHAPASTTCEEEILVLSASCSQTMACNTCFKNIAEINDELPTVKCPNCHMRQKKEYITKAIKCEIQAKMQNSTARKFNLSNSIITACQELQELNTPDELEHFLIMHPKLIVKMTTSKTQIMGITKIV